MASDPMWKRDANGIAHPGSEILLAFIREQCSEDEKNCISEHLSTGCMSCNRLLAGLTQDSNALSHLQYMPRYLYYPGLQSNQVLLHARRGEPLTSMWTGKRKRKFQAQSRQQLTRRYAHKGSVRIVSLPAAFALLLIFMTAVIVLAYTVVNSGLHIPLPGQQTNNIHSNSGPNTPVVAPHQLTPTNTVSLTPTTTVIAVKGPALATCSSAHYVGSDIFICGTGFNPGDKISLKVDYYRSNSLKTVGPYFANKSGGFKASWRVSCRNSPVTIYAIDETQHTVTAPLTNISRSGCNESTPTTSPGGYQYRTN